MPLACKSARTPPPEPKPDKPADVAPPGPRTDNACAPSGASCFDRAQTYSDDEPMRAETLLLACSACDDAPPATFRLLAAIREDRGATAEARDALKQGVRKHPNNGLLYLALGRLEIAVGHKTEGLAALATAHRLHPSDEDVEREYKEALARHGTDEDRVEAAVDQLVREAAGRVEIDDYKGARDTLKTALDRSGKIPRLVALVHERLALVALRKGEHQAARDELEKSLAADKAPSGLRAETLVSYSEVMLSLDRPQDAIRAAEEAIVIEPMNPLAHANIGIAHSMRNDRDGAMKALSRAFDCGLSRKLSLGEFLAIRPIDKLKSHPDFGPMVRRAWPSSSYPPP
jgi:tetratricopeptide (TPR) repeat protein